MQSIYRRICERRIVWEPRVVVTTQPVLRHSCRIGEEGRESKREEANKSFKEAEGDGADKE